MASKSPISILQEYAVKKGMPYPIYNLENLSTKTTNLFKYTVCTGELTATGTGLSKHEAKHECAKKALALLADDPIPVEELESNFENLSFSNYVGELNEFSSKSGLPYPEYQEEHELGNGIFHIHCSHITYQTMGEGKNKKDAKQIAARNMLQK